MGHFGGAVAAYNSTLVFSGRNIFQYNHADLGGGVFAKGSHLVFSGFTAFIGNDAEFGGGGVTAINSCMHYSELLLTVLPYDPNVYIYVRNTAGIGGGLLLVNSSMTLGKDTLNFTANKAEKGGGIYSRSSKVTLEGMVLFRDNSAGRYKEGFGGAAYVRYSMWTTRAVTFTGNSATVDGGAVYTEFSHMNFTGIMRNLSEETDIPFFKACAHTCLTNTSARVVDGGGLQVLNSTVVFDGNTLLEHNSAGAFGGGIAARAYNKLSFK